MSAKREISESAFEYLLSELLSVIESQNLSSSDISIKLERMGYQIGYKYVEKVISVQKPLGKEPLDIIKFMCKEFYEVVFQKKVNLFTNKLNLNSFIHCLLTYRKCILCHSDRQVTNKSQRALCIG